MIESRTVDWYSVHCYVLPLLEEVGSWPLVGTLTWQQLDDADPVKLAAIFDAARHHALRVDASQAAVASASRDICTAADWTAVARSLRRGRGAAYVPRRSA